MNIKRVYIKRAFTALVLTACSGFAAFATAAPYQFQVDAGLGQVKLSSSFGGGSVDGDVLVAGLTYYLRIVDTNTGPLRERAFLDKAAFVSASFEQVKYDQADGDSKSIAGRFVTTENLIFELGLSQLDDSDSDPKSIGIGKYLDDNTTAILSYQNSGGGDLNVFQGRWRKLNNDASGGTATALELNAGLIDADDSNGFLFGVSGTRYINQQTSIGVSLSYSDIDDFDSLALVLTGGYFFAENLFADLSYEKLEFDGFLDTDTILLQLGARF